MQANAMSQTFLLARKLGVFHELMEGQKTVIQLAEKLNLATRPLELMLDQLVETWFIEKYEYDYALSVLGKMLPVEWTDLGNRYWEQLEDWIRTGQRLAPSDSEYHDSDFALESQAFEWMSTPNALDLIQILNIGQSRIGSCPRMRDCGQLPMLAKGPVSAPRTGFAMA